MKLPAEAAVQVLERGETTRVFRKALVFCAESHGFGMATAVFDHPLAQTRILAELETGLAGQDVHLDQCAIPATGSPSLLDELARFFADHPLPPGSRRAVIVTGINEHLADASMSFRPDSPAPGILARANLERERFPAVCPYPVLFCLYPATVGQFVRFAPDLWHWCLHNFDFTSPGEAADPRGAARSMLEIENTGAGETYANCEELLRAETIFRRGLQAAAAKYGDHHPTAVAARRKLANALRQKGKYSEAVQLAEENLQVVESSTAFTDTDRAIEMNNLASLLQATNRLAEAEPLKRRALAINEASFGSEHPNVAISLNNLAQLLQSTNRLAEAEPLMRRALAIDEASFGPEHPKVAIRLNNLASLLQATNRLAEAEPLKRRALAISEASFGSEHPDVAIRLNNLASLLQATNRLVEAEPLMRRALAIDEASYGPEHPKVAIRLNNLAQLLQETNRLAEAESLMRRHLEILLKFTTTTGHPYPHLSTAFANYHHLLTAMGDTDDQARVKITALTAGYGPLLETTEF